MNYFKKGFFGVFVLSAILIPNTLYAQTTATTDGSNDTQVIRRDYMRKWRQGSNDLQQKISTLASTSTFSVFIPVLLGVEINNLYPNFHDPRSNGRIHEGEDIMALKDTPIVSPTPAVVIRTGTGAGEGNYVYTANPGGETFVYMHLDAFGEGVVPGAILEQGSLIGYVGNTGNASGGAPHLHFEIHDSNGLAIDPYPRLIGTFTLQEKIKYLSKILTQSTASDKLSKLFVINFRSTFITASSTGIFLPQIIVTLLETPKNITSTNTASTSLSLTRNLYIGITGSDVLMLQKFLNTHGFIISNQGAGSLGNETMYFGNATKSAIIRFQIAHTINPAVGYVGPLTRNILTSLSM